MAIFYHFENYSYDMCYILKPGKNMAKSAILLGVLCKNLCQIGQAVPEILEFECVLFRFLKKSD